MEEDKVLAPTLSRHNVRLDHRRPQSPGTSACIYPAVWSHSGQILAVGMFQMRERG